MTISELLSHFEERWPHKYTLERHTNNRSIVSTRLKQLKQDGIADFVEETRYDKISGEEIPGTRHVWYKIGHNVKIESIIPVQKMKEIVDASDISETTWEKYIINLITGIQIGSNSADGWLQFFEDMLETEVTDPDTLEIYFPEWENLSYSDRVTKVRALTDEFLTKLRAEIFRIFNLMSDAKKSVDI